MDWTYLIYLYFINRNGSFQSSLNEIFHFHRFISINEIYKWNRLFYVDEEKIYDSEYKNVLSTLRFHHFIDENHVITNSGLLFLTKSTQDNIEINHVFSQFILQYRNQTFLEDTCYVSHPNFTASCSNCIDKMCVNSKLSINDVLYLFNFKGFRNPYKKRSIKPE